jgi:starvation-inducible outer membrane lipoprotein
MRSLVQWLLLLALALSGCVMVPATRRGTLSKRCMQFQEDGDELVLENHLVDSREGSSGARGARGGGCGCN